METKLRVGGACVVKPRGGKEWRGAAGEEYAPNMMHVMDSTGYRACCAVHTVSPAPFIPGDVVEHSQHPEYVRGLVVYTNDELEIARVCWTSDGQGAYAVTREYADHHDGYRLTDLTLILPAQEAR